MTKDGKCTYYPALDTKQDQSRDKWAGTTHQIENAVNQIDQHPSLDLATQEAEMCLNKGQLVCSTGQCYHISEICSLMLNQENFLVPCRTGDHLQNCSAFQCNGKYKCPQFYCVPWHYVCNGKWNCPQGFDEVACKSNRSCEHMFKCKMSSLCVHFHDICNDENNCPQGDDELLCVLHATECPSQCQCAAVVLFCHNISSRAPLNFQKLPYLVVHVTQTDKLFVLSLLKESSFAFLFLEHNMLEAVCSKLQTNHLHKVDLGFNLMKVLQKNCFAAAPHLKHIGLNDNHLKTVEKGCFNDLPKLSFVNLSNNVLASFASDLCHTCPLIKIIDIQNNTFELLAGTSFTTLSVIYVMTDEYKVCCLVSRDVTCLAKPQWFQSCSSLLGPLSIKITFYTLFSVVFVANLVSLVLQKVSLKHTSKKQSGAFEVSVASVNATDILCSVYLLILWVVDVSYGNSFVLQETAWASHPMCFVVFAVRMLFAMASPLSLCFLSFSRLMVVLHPVDSKFKNRTFVFHCILVYTGVLILFSVILTGTMAVSGHVLFTLCSPFVDPEKKSALITFQIYFCTLVQISATTFIIASYSYLVVSVKSSQKQLQAAMSVQKSNKALIFQLLVVIISNLLCWIPSSVIYLIAMHSDEYPITIVVWNTVVVTTFNSVVNPLVFTLVTLRKLADKSPKPTQAHMPPAQRKQDVISNYV